MKMNILNNSGKLVVLDISTFVYILEHTPKKVLIEKFAKIHSHQKEWKKLKKNIIIDKIIDWEYYQTYIEEK